MPFVAGQTDEQIIHRIDAHQSDKSSQKNHTSILNSRRENHVLISDGENRVYP